VSHKTVITVYMHKQSINLFLAKYIVNSGFRNHSCRPGGVIFKVEGEIV